MTHIRIASYNIRKSVGLDWKRNPERIIAVINETQADIIALQEIDRRFGSRESSLCLNTIEQDTDYKLLSAPSRKLSHGYRGNAILVRKNYGVQNIQSIGLNSFEPRGAVAADIHINENVSIRFIGTHLALLKYWRKKQIHQILKSFVQPSPFGVNIIAGDFNEWKQNKGFYQKAITQPFEIVKSGASFHASKPTIALDKFIIIGEDYEIKQSGVLQSALSRKASDHLPIWTDIAINAIK